LAFVIFWQKNIDTKSAPKMLMKLTNGLLKDCVEKRAKKSEDAKSVFHSLFLREKKKQVGKNSCFVSYSLSASLFTP